MKHLLLFAMLVLLISSCNNAADHFVGKWQSVRHRMAPELTIEKDGSQYLLKKSTNLNDTVRLEYNDETKSLNGRVNGADIELKYIEATHNLTFGAVGDTRYMEFKKVK